jgi:nucleoid DNA-binding protein
VAETNTTCSVDVDREQVSYDEIMPEVSVPHFRSGGRPGGHMSSKRMTQGQFVTALAEKSGLTGRQAKGALAAIQTMVAHELSSKGPGEVILPGLLKLSLAHKPATRQHEGINPFTKEPMQYKARAARTVVKMRVLKALKDAV